MMGEDRGVPYGWIVAATFGTVALLSLLACLPNLWRWWKRRAPGVTEVDIGAGLNRRRREREG